jgi:hypothetical protein
MNDFPDDSHAEDGRYWIPPAAVDRWLLNLEDDTLTSGPFEIRQPDGKKPTAILRTGTYSAVELGEHRSIRGAISACRDVALAVRRATERDAPEEVKDHEPDPDLSASYAERYEIELLNRRRNSNGRQKR